MPIRPPDLRTNLLRAGGDSPAIQGFRAIVNARAEAPVTLKAMYFLGRTLMKTGHYPEAETLFIRIYQADRPFYDDWQCDFLLGECRRAQGKG